MREGARTAPDWTGPDAGGSRLLLLTATWQRAWAVVHLCSPNIPRILFRVKRRRACARVLQ